MSNIIPITGGEATGSRCRRLLKEWETASDRWLEKTLEFAAALLAGREECGSNDTRFSHWLIDNGLERLDYQTRTALIGMAIHPELAADVLRETGRQSIRHIWQQEIKPRLAKHAVAASIHIEGTKSLHDRADIPRGQPILDRNDMNAIEEPRENEGLAAVMPDQEVGSVAPVDAESPAASPASVPVKEASAMPDAPDTRNQTVTAARGITPQAGYYGMPRAEEIMALFPHRNARSTLSMAMKDSAAAKKEIWSLVLTCADAGLLRQTNYSGTTASRKLPLKYLLSDLPDTLSRDYDLTFPAVRKEVRTVILPAILDQKDAFLKDPASLKRLVNNWKIKRSAERAADLQANPPVHVPPNITPPASHPVIVMFGVQLWPIVENRYGDYDYDQLRTAIWAFQETDRTLQCGSLGTSPKSRAIMMRFSTRYYARYAERALDTENGRRMRGVFQLVHTLATLLETTPDGVCTPPVAPHGNLGWD